MANATSLQNYHCITIVLPSYYNCITIVMNWPIYFKDRLYLGNLDSPVALCTLWTPKETIVEQLDKSNFCVAGQLYSGRGLNFMVRNLLAKPSIQYLVVCGRSLNNSSELLFSFFENGDGEEEYIDKEVPRTVLAKLRGRINVIDLEGELDFSVIKKAISKCKLLDSDVAPQVFPDPEYIEKEAFPAESSVFRISGNYIGEVWLSALKHILKFGVSGERIGGCGVRCVHNLAAVVGDEDPRCPKIFPFFNFNLSDVENYIKNFFDPKLGQHSYSYGGRLQDYRGVDQIKVMKEKLKRFSGEEGALAVLWDPVKDNFPPEEGASKKLGKAEKWNVPCLNLVQAQIYGGNLFLTTYFRAHDIYNAWPRNLFALRELQARLAEFVELELGSLTVFSQFAWISESDLPQAQEIVADNYQPSCVWDPRGNFVIMVRGSTINAVHLSPEGRKLQEFSINGEEPKAAVKLCGEIIGELAISDLSHAADLGRELAKAEMAVKNDLNYQQDNSLEF